MEKVIHIDNPAETGKRSMNLFYVKRTLSENLMLFQEEGNVNAWLDAGEEAARTYKVILLYYAIMPDSYEAVFAIRGPEKKLLSFIREMDSGFERRFKEGNSVHAFVFGDAQVFVPEMRICRISCSAHLFEVLRYLYTVPLKWQEETGINLGITEPEDWWACSAYYLSRMEGKEGPEEDFADFDISEILS